MALLRQLEEVGGKDDYPLPPPMCGNAPLYTAVVYTQTICLFPGKHKAASILTF
jgi:hypothetical protein